MSELTTLAADASPDAIQDVMLRDGAAIIRDAADPDRVKRMQDEVAPYVERTPTGRDDFTGRSTQRTGALIARTPTCREFVLDETILRAAEKFLAPYTERIILHLTQTIHILPGQGAQLTHRDRLAWGTHLPRTIEPQFNTLWALTDFTEEAPPLGGLGSNSLARGSTRRQVLSAWSTR